MDIAAAWGRSMDEIVREARDAVVVDQADDEAIVAYRPLLPDEQGCARE